MTDENENLRTKMEIAFEEMDEGLLGSLAEDMNDDN
jgi:hypothetical protein